MRWAVALTALGFGVLPLLAQSPPGIAFPAELAPEGIFGARARERGAGQSVGFLLNHVRTGDGTWRQESEAYAPREGDLVFFNDHSLKWGILYKLVGSDAPYHVGIVFRHPEGHCAIVEAGPNDTLKCRVLELPPRFHAWAGTLQVRRCKVDLTPQQSNAMTVWALAQDQKRYALGRLLLQGTPVRARGPVRKALFGATYTDRSSYLCAELAVAAGTVGGIFDPAKHKANTIYPRDIIANDIHDLSDRYHDAQVWLPSRVDSPGR